MGSTWLGVILIGFFAGLLARLFSSDPRNPQGCLLTTVLGIVGSAFFTWLGSQVGFYAPGESAGFLGAIVGSVIVLAIWRSIAARH